TPAPTPTPTPSPTPTPTPAPTPTAADFLVAGLATSNSTQNPTLYVIDPAAPSTPRFSTAVTPVATGVVSQSVVTAWDGTWSSNPRPTVNIHGSSHAYYTQNGKVFDVSLRKSEAQTPKQLSSLANACFVFFRWQLESTGNDTWVQVATTTTGTPCSTTAF